MTLSIVPAEADSPEALALMAELSARLAEITGDSGSASFDVSEMRAANACFYWHAMRPVWLWAAAPSVGWCRELPR